MDRDPVSKCDRRSQYVIPVCNEAAPRERKLLGFDACVRRWPLPREGDTGRWVSGSGEFEAPECEFYERTVTSARSGDFRQRNVGLSGHGQGVAHCVPHDDVCLAPCTDIIYAPSGDVARTRGGAPHRCTPAASSGGAAESSAAAVRPGGAGRRAHAGGWLASARADDADGGPDAAADDGDISTGDAGVRSGGGGGGPGAANVRTTSAERGPWEPRSRSLGLRSGPVEPGSCPSRSCSSGWAAARPPAGSRRAAARPRRGAGRCAGPRHLHPPGDAHSAADAGDDNGFAGDAGGVGSGARGSSQSRGGPWH